MTSVLVPVVVAAVSLAFTYFFCLRPMHRGHGQCASPARQVDAAAEVEALRLEVAALRANAHPRRATDDSATY